MNLDPTTTQTLGASLRPINPSWMKAEQDEDGTHQRLWYQGREPYFDVIIEKTGDTITWFQITLRGRIVSWHKTRSHLLTGETEELDVPPEIAYYAATKGVRDSASVNWSLVKTFQAILAAQAEDPTLSQLAALLADQISAHQAQ
ncbi:MAG: hypothetical protein IGR92_09055 [Leptolyngbyaceae cyanobacterium T60_A2020_046]|nr:hypothetical protein [Leptolyngbyaceae cyanobacterium T60_A2020_046]